MKTSGRGCKDRWKDVRWRSVCVMCCVFVKVVEYFYF